MSSERYPAGTRLIWTADPSIVGTVVTNYKLPGDICVDWNNGLRSSYDEQFLADNTKKVETHWPDCALNHGGSECDMGPECGT